MTAFDAYAASYDLLYRDKDYAGEAAFVLDQLRAERPVVADVLELGCGTGAHAAELAARGIAVHGIDLSTTMVARAEARRAALPADVAGRLSFEPGDARRFDSSRRFDAVVSLFHVMSYQTSDADLAAALRTAARHLRPGGVFLFDLWFGPAVAADLPVARVKQVENEAFRVTRRAEPRVDAERRLVQVDYLLGVERKATGQTEEVSESHRLRYWFFAEIDRHAHAAGLATLGPWRWMTREPADAGSWLAWVVCRKPTAADAA